MGKAKPEDNTIVASSVDPIQTAIPSSSSSNLIGAAPQGSGSYPYSTPSYKRFVGTPNADTLVGTSADETFRGYASNDSMTGGGGKDTFIFEATLADNGTDTISDFQVRAKGEKYDVLDLRNAIPKGVKADKYNISQYAWIVGDKVYVDPTGTGTASTPWAVLSGVKAGDEVRIKAGKFDGWIKSEEDPLVYLSLDRSGAWFDDNQNGVRDGGESNATLTAAGSLFTVDGVEMAADNVTLRVVDLNVPTPLDLTGFGTDDKVIFDTKTNKNSWFGFSGYAYWKLSSRPAFTKTATKPGYSLTSNNAGRYSLNARSFALSTKYLARHNSGRNRMSIGNYVAGTNPNGTRLNGYFRNGWSGRWTNNGFQANWPSAYNGVNGKYSWRLNPLIAANMGAGYTVEVLQP